MTSGWRGGKRDPLEVVAGLPLVVRTVLTLQKSGMSRIVVVSAREDVRAAVTSDRRVRARLCVVGAIAEAAGEGRAIVAWHDVVAEPSVYQPLAARARVAIATHDGAALGPALVDLAALPCDFDHLTGESVETPGAVHVCDDEGAGRATRALFEACRKPLDGIVSRHLNRHISIFLSKRLVGTWLTPNQVSAFTLLLGIAAGVCVARASYGWIVLGAALQQVHSVLDGVDGELARVRFEQSRFGEWLDNISDDVTALGFWGGLTLSAVPLAYGTWLVRAGYVAIVAHILLVAITYVERLLKQSGSYFDPDWFHRRASGLRARVMAFVVLIPRRDFFVLFCFVAALAGVLPQMLPLIAIASVATLLATVSRHVREALERRRLSS